MFISVKMMKAKVLHRGMIRFGMALAYHNWTGRVTKIVSKPFLLCYYHHFSKICPTLMFNFYRYKESEKKKNETI